MNDNPKDDVNKYSNNSLRINQSAIDRFKKTQNKSIDIERLFVSITNKDRVALSQGITLIESANLNHIKKSQTLIEKCLPFANNSIRIGITGVPGVGKSTFIETFGNLLINQGKKVAVLAIDPSSSLSKGSILGDKTRMESLAKSNNAFIRPSPTGKSLGGVAQKTRESIILCEAAGFDIILIETVGVGQNEITAHSMVDFFLVLKLAGAGDELQGIKRGIIELADAIVINKADGSNISNVEKAKRIFKNVLDLFPLVNKEWTPKVLSCSAKNNIGIKDIWDMILQYIETHTQNGFFEDNRKEQNKFWLIQSIEEQLGQSFYNNPIIKKELAKQLESVQNNKVSPFTAASQLIKLYK